jgi:hypothetical protein
MLYFPTANYIFDNVFYNQPNYAVRIVSQLEKTKGSGVIILLRTWPIALYKWNALIMNTLPDDTKNIPAKEIQYDPDRLLDALIEKLHLKNDAALSRALEVAPPVISKIRHRRLPVGASLLIRMHEVSELSIRDLRVLMGDRREKYRISDKQFKPKPTDAKDTVTE